MSLELMEKNHPGNAALWKKIPPADIYGRDVGFKCEAVGTEGGCIDIPCVFPMSEHEP